MGGRDWVLLGGGSVNWRSKKLRESARHESCVSCGANDGSVVWAHSNEQRHGKGMGIKAHDLFGAYLCHKCHTQYDQGPQNRQSKEQFFFACWEKSMIRACEKGYL
jgi:hypothetical protein